MSNNQNIFISSIDDLNFKSNLENALTNGLYFVAVTSGKIEDINLLKRLYELEEEILNSNIYNVNVHEHYSDDGINFLASVSFIKKELVYKG